MKHEMQRIHAAKEDAKRLLALCQRNPGIGVDGLAEKSGLPLEDVARMTVTLRKNAYMVSARKPDGKVIQAHYVITQRGIEYAEDAPAVLYVGVKPEPKRPSHYKPFAPIEMVSHRPGAWDASKIERRGLPC